MEIIKEKIYTREDVKKELNIGSEVIQSMFNDPRLKKIEITKKDLVLGSCLLEYFEIVSNGNGRIRSRII